MGPRVVWGNKNREKDSSEQIRIVKRMINCSKTGKMSHEQLNYTFV